jgi:hypothetical protein
LFATLALQYQVFESFLSFCRITSGNLSTTLLLQQKDYH